MMLITLIAGSFLLGSLVASSALIINRVGSGHH